MFVDPSILLGFVVVGFVISTGGRSTGRARRLFRLALGGVAGIWAAAQAEPGLVLTSPLDYQVVQRDAGNCGVIEVSGKLDAADGKAGSISARLVAETKEGPWRPLTAAGKDGEFRATLKVPAGGWYRLEVRSVSGGQPVTTMVEHVGVGEVFVVAGQSNSANYGEERLTPQSGRVATFDVDNHRWQPANDPQPGASGTNGSFLPPLGDALAQRFQVPVGFVSCGIGATSVREWLPKGVTFPEPPTIENRVTKLADHSWTSDGGAYTMLVRRMKQLGPNGFRAVLWHQGESDVNQPDPKRTLSGELYGRYLTQIINESRKETGWNAPWFVALVSYHTPAFTGSPEMRAAQKSLWDKKISLEGPDSDALNGDLREANGQGVHFSGKGQREHGARWAEKVGAWLAKIESR